jgi:uncharacterized protein (TIGR00290 family)
MKAFMNWSGGKDSSLCLYRAQRQGLPVQALLTSLNAIHNRISMHGVRRALLEQQSYSLGLPLHTIELPEQPGMETYEQALRARHRQLLNHGFSQAVYGDIFLEDLKAYREELLSKDGLKACFPLWKEDTAALMEEFLQLGFRAIVVCVDGNLLGKEFCGREIDAGFVKDLPPGVDICGENGEYHSFVFDGPIFSKPVSFAKGEIVYREYAAPSSDEKECFSEPQKKSGFYFCDLLPLG